jgi:copper chaperone
MFKKFKVLNVKCDGCASTLKKSLKEDFGDVEVDLSVDPRVITVAMEDEDTEKLKLKLRDLGYPLETDELSTFQSFKTTAKSFVSCSIGKIDNLTK